MLLSIMIILLLAVITFPGIKLKNSQPDQAVLSVDESTSLKGLMCVTIFLHHFSGWIVPQTPVIYILSHCGSFMVSVFFLLSGYGLTKSSRTSNLPNTFLIKRLVKLFIPYWLCEIIYLIFNCFSSVRPNVELNAKNIIASVFTLSEVVSFSWYVTATIFLYIVFFFTSKIKKSNHALCVFVILLAVVAFVPDLWVTFFAFPLGMIFAQKESLFSKLSNKKYILILAAIILITIVAIVPKYIGQNLGSQALMNLSDAISGTLFASIIFLIATKFKISNRILLFFGKISYEFYLMHGLMISFISKFAGPEKPIVFCLASLISIIFVSTAVNFIQQKISSPIIKKLR